MVSLRPGAPQAHGSSSTLRFVAALTGDPRPASAGILPPSKARGETGSCTGLGQAAQQKADCPRTNLEVLHQRKEVGSVTESQQCEDRIRLLFHRGLAASSQRKNRRAYLWRNLWFFLCQRSQPKPCILRSWYPAIAKVVTDQREGALAGATPVFFGSEPPKPHLATGSTGRSRQSSFPRLEG